MTYLEMTAPAPSRPCPEPEGCELRTIERPDIDWYRDLFFRVGGRDWLWSSCLMLTEDELRDVLHDPGVIVFALERDGHPEGLLQLDLRVQGACELAFFGVTRDLAGTTAGRYMMNRAISEAWSHDIGKFHVHTCTLDHPRALEFYRRSGFVPVRQEVEVMADPRLSGVLPKDAAPHVPLFSK
ncbi:MAG: GNAT family N-acetyltransferase [Arenibacterium sp.]